jgi:archaeal type IV pilus assembly protein PilA
MTNGPSSKDDFYIPPVPAGTPRPKNPNDKYILAFFAFHLCALLILHPFDIPYRIGPHSLIEDTRVIQSKAVAVTVQQPDPGTILVTYRGGQDAGSLTALTVTVTDHVVEEQTKSLMSGTGSPLIPGAELVFKGEYDGYDHVVAVGRFSDGTEQAVLDTVL